MDIVYSTREFKKSAIHAFLMAYEKATILTLSAGRFAE